MSNEDRAAKLINHHFYILNLLPEPATELIMGFADLSIAEIAKEYHLSETKVLDLCHQLGITYQSSQTRLALEDAKAVITHILAEQKRSSG